jgi:ferredoxin
MRSACSERMTDGTERRSGILQRIMVTPLESKDSSRLSCSCRASTSTVAVVTLDASWLSTSSGT